MIVAVPKEIAPGERRVAVVPETVAKLVKSGTEVVVQAGAGLEAGYRDGDYEKAGARVVADVASLYGNADVVLKVEKPRKNDATGEDEVELLKPGSVLIAILDPLRNEDLVRRLAERNITSFSMDAIPRITRAQSMDVLSSQASIAGYKAVLLAANALPRLFPMMTTAAGTIRPAKVFVLGAGVAGLQAIATAKRLGAVVEAFDVRAVTKEQVESLGARFVHIDLEEDAETAGGYAKEVSEETHRREQELIHRHAREADVIITTAQIPGKPAPRLITEAMVEDMKQGSVIVDVAAPTGGNCELTEVGKDVVKHGVTIMGPANLPAMVPYHASQMYSRNIVTFFETLIKDGKVVTDLADEVVKSCLVTDGGRVVFPPLQAKNG